MFMRWVMDVCPRRLFLIVPYSSQRLALYRNSSEHMDNLPQYILGRGTCLNALISRLALFPSLSILCRDARTTAKGNRIIPSRPSYPLPPVAVFSNSYGASSFLGCFGRTIVQYLDYCC